MVSRPAKQEEVWTVDAIDAIGADAPAFGGVRLLASVRRGPRNWRLLMPPLDLGPTNNCRLLVASPRRMMDFASSMPFPASSGWARGLSQRRGASARLRSNRTPGQRLAICRDKDGGARRQPRARLIATEACRAADKTAAFVDQVFRAHRIASWRSSIARPRRDWAATGCGPHWPTSAARRCVVLFDIGGGSSRSRLARPRRALLHGRRRRGPPWGHAHPWPGRRCRSGRLARRNASAGATSSGQTFDAHVGRSGPRNIARLLRRRTRREDALRMVPSGLGTSGNPSRRSAGVHLGLLAVTTGGGVDGLWMPRADVDAAHAAVARDELCRARRQSLHRAGPGPTLVLAGCAIFEGRSGGCSRRPGCAIADSRLGAGEGILTGIDGKPTGLLYRKLARAAPSMRSGTGRSGGD